MTIKGYFCHFIGIVFAILVVQPRGVDAGYLGCYLENKRLRHLSVSPGDYDPAKLTPLGCTTNCGNLGYDLAGLHAGKFCFCGTTAPPRPEESVPSPCSTTCWDGSECGSLDHISVYSTTPWTGRITGLKIDVVSSNVIELYNSGTFELFVDEGWSLDYQLDYGDGAGPSEKNGTYILSKTFAMVGEYDVTAIATDASGMAVESRAAIAVLVSSPISGTSLSCPTMIATYEEFKCDVTIKSGSSMIATMNFKDGTSDSFAVADPWSHFAGLVIPERSAVQTTPAVFKTIVMPASEFHYDGVIIAWEYYAEKAGTLQFMVLRPDCIPTYCYENNDCTTGCNLPHEYTCATSTKFCIHKRICESNCPASAARYSSSQPKTNYRIQYVESVTVAIGYGVHQMDPASAFVVQAGDVLGYDKVTAELSVVDSDATYNDFQMDGVTLLAGELLEAFTVVASKRHLLRAIATQSSLVATTHTFTTVGTYEVIFNVSNNLLGSYQVIGHSVAVSEGIDIAVLDVPAYAETDSPVTISLLPHTGSDVQYAWDFGDGSTPLVTSVPTTTHVFIASGSYEITVNATNSLSLKSNASMISVETAISGLVIYAIPSPTSEIAEIWLNMTKGTNYLCKWSVNGIYAGQSLDSDTPATGGSFNLSFPSVGAFSVSVTCDNHLSSMSTSVIQLVQDPLLGLTLVKTGAMKNIPYAIEWTINQGTDVSFQLTIDEVSVSVIYDPTSKSGKTETFPGESFNTYTIVLVGSNLVSEVTVTETFTIEEPIEDPVCTSSDTVISFGSSVDFTVSMKAGTGVNVEWNFGDSATDRYSLQPGSAWTPDATQTKSHIYGSPGLYDVIVTISNGFSSFIFEFTISAMIGVKNMVISFDPSAVVFEPPGDVSFTLSQTLGPEPTLASVDIDYSDELSPQTFPLALNQPFPHVFYDSGIYDIVVNISNLLNWQTVTTSVHVVERLVDLSIIVDPPHAPVNQNVKVMLNMWRGCGPNVNLEWDFGTGIGDVKTSTSTASCPDGLETEIFQYNNIGSYVIAVTVTTPLETKRVTYNIDSVNPVTRDFVLENDAPISFDSNAVSNTVTYTLSYPDTSILPTDASLECVYGDGSTSGPVPLAMSLQSYVINIARDFTAAGVYDSIFIISNKAGQEEFSVKAEVLVNIAAISVQPLFRPDIPIGAPYQPGLGPASNEFPVYKHVQFDVTVLTGTITSYTMEAVSGSAIETCVHVDEPFTHDFQLPGTYTVKVTATNAFTSDNNIFTIIIQDRITVPDITDMGVTMAGENRTISVHFDNFGQDSCAVIDFADGSDIQIYGPSRKCDPHPKYLSAVYTGILANTFTVSHLYETEGSYNVRVTAFNDINTVTKVLAIPVPRNPCIGPLIDIVGKHEEIANPWKWIRSSQIRIIGTTVLNCSETLLNVKQWTVDKVARETGQLIEHVDLSTLISRSNAELALPPLFLSNGMYKFTYHVQMDSAHMTENLVIAGSVFTYVMVVSSDLVVVLAAGGTTLMTVTYGRQLRLTPDLFSYDPDLQPGTPQVFDEFIWLCKRQDDQDYPLEPDGSLDHGTIPLSTSPLTTPITDRGGCFGTGPGRLGFTGGQITINTNQLIITTYEIMVVIKKDTRENSAVVMVQVQELPSPQVIIECAAGSLCVQQPVGQRVNPSARLGLYGKCLEGCPTGEVIRYEWQLFVYHHAWPWRPVLNQERVLEGLLSENIAIRRSIYDQYPDAPKFKVRLTASTESTAVGTAEMEFHVNRAPSGGHCSITPEEGILGKNPRSIQCVGFTDPDGIASYHFYATFRDTEEEYYLSTDHNSAITAQLPIGPIWDDYRMDVYVRIYDTLGAYASVFVGRVKVSPQSRPETETLIERMFSGTDLRVDEIIARSDLQETSSELLTIASLLNQPEYAGVSMVSHEINPGYGPLSFVHTDTQKANASDNELFNEQRNKLTRIRTQIVSGLGRVTLATMSSVSQVAGTLTEAIRYPEQNSRIAQNDISTILTRAADVLDAQASISTVEEVISAAKNLVSVSGLLLQAPAYQKQNPTADDLKEAENHNDYDTDLESEDDLVQSLDPSIGYKELTFSTNGKLQKATSRDASGTVSRVLRSVAVALAKLSIAGEEPVQIRTEMLSLYLEKNPVAKMFDKEVIREGVSVKFPPPCQVLPADKCTSNDYITLQVVTMPTFPYSLTKRNKVVSDKSHSVEINFLNANGDQLAVQDTKQDIEISIPMNFDNSSLNPVTIEPSIPETRPWESMFYHRIDVVADDISLHIKIKPSDDSANFLVLVRCDGKLPNITTREYDFARILPPLNTTIDPSDDEQPDPYIAFIGNKDFPPNWKGPCFVGLRQLIDDEIGMDVDALLESSRENRGRFTGTYDIETFTGGCYYYDEKLEDWASSGCAVGPLTSHKKTQCFCNHVTPFAGGWAVVPNKIDWNFIFSNLDFYKNPTIYITEIIIALLYIAIMIWARYQDKKDVSKLGVAPLPDNNPQDKYYYEIIVGTGLRKGAATKSKVYFVLSGEHDETDVRALADSKRTIMTRGSVDSFLMAVPRPLGSLQYVRVWHDNSGKGEFASWYLKYFLVRDLYTRRKYQFINNRWLAVEEDDGSVDRVIPVAGAEQMTEFSHLFSMSSQKNLKDGHLWFSVVARPPTSRFTRTQRVSCCLSLLFLTMLANALYYDTAAGSTNKITFGPFSLSPEQIFVGVITNLIVFPVSFLLVFLFRKSRPRKKRQSRIHSAMNHNVFTNAASMTDIKPELDQSKWSLRQSANSGTRSQMGVKSVIGSADITIVTSPVHPDSPMIRSPDFVVQNPLFDRRNLIPKKKKHFSLPWWCTIVAWILLWLTVLTSLAFVTFFAIMFGDEKCKKWISSLLIAFVMSIFITQPIKVFLTAILFSFLIRKPSDEDDDAEDDEEEPHLANDEDYMYTPWEEDGYGAARARKIGYKPLDQEALKKARDRRLKEVQMYAVIREIILYALFIWILMVISYGNRDPNAYLYKSGMEDVFTRRIFDKTTYPNITNTKQFWRWSKSVFVKGIRAGPYYNNAPPLLLRGFMNDKVSRIMGYATMRQLRVKKDSCEIPSKLRVVVNECNAAYSPFAEDTTRYSPDWKPYNKTTGTRDEYTYFSSDQLNGYPFMGKSGLYDGGGYLLRLRGSDEVLVNMFTTLEKEDWIDKYTRAVFIEFTVYNAQVNLFMIATFLAEMLPTGGILPSYRFDSVRLLTYMTSAMLFQIVCDVVFLLFIIYFIYQEIRKVFKMKWKYFNEFWNWIEVVLIALSITGAVLYFYRLFVTNGLTSYFNETHGNEYMKFQYVGYWNETLGYIIGLLVFLGTLKFLRLLRFNRRISMLASTLRNGGRSMVYFTIIFLIVFLAFAQLFYVSYFTDIADFSMFVGTIESCFLIMMGKFDFNAMRYSKPFITAVFFFLFVVSVTFILVNMFISILNESFSSVKSDIGKQANDYEIVDFMMTRFKLWTGIGGGAKPAQKQDVLNNQRPQLQQCVDERAVDDFPDKVDQLLDTISNAYLRPENFESGMNPSPGASKSNLKKLMRGNVNEFSSPRKNLHGFGQHHYPAEINLNQAHQEKY